MGHGYDAMDELIKALRIYAEAGMYKWLNKNPDFAPEFKKMIDTHYRQFVSSVKTGKTYFDWNRNFITEFKREIEAYEKECVSYVWYAAYGSNINKDRFMKYIKNCNDISEPAETREFEFDHNIYFARKSSLWKGAVAFLDDKNAGKAMGKIYLIKETQFMDIMRMEGSFYNKKLNLGNIEGYPVYTFTEETRTIDDKAPSCQYLDTILEGLSELHPEKKKESLELYLYLKVALNDEAVKILGCIRSSEHAIKLKNIVGKTCISKTKVTKAIKKLQTIGLITKDSRSNNAADEEAMFYTYINKRDCIDLLISEGQE